MPLMNPARPGALLVEALPAGTSAGVTIAANASANTKGATPTQLIASTAADSYGIFVHIDSNSTSNTSTATLLDIMTGAGGSEVVLIPDLMAGWSLPVLTATNRRTYFFPIFIPASTRLSARSASAVSAKTCVVGLTLLQRPSQLGFVGTRVTAYGPGSNSRGVDSTSGTSPNYGTAVSLSASTTNPIRYMQIGLDPGDRGTVTDQFCKAALYTGSSAIVTGLSGATDTSVEAIGFEEANRQLSQMMWNFPAGIDLKYATMASSGVNFSGIAYGVD